MFAINECLLKASNLVFLFAIGLAAVIAICTRAPDQRITFIVSVGILAFFGGGMHKQGSTNSNYALAILFSGTFFPVLEAIAVRMGKSIPGCATWSYSGRDSVPPWLFPLWACTGLFVVSMHDAIQCALEAPGLPGFISRPLVTPFTAISNPIVLAASTLVAAGIFFAMLAYNAHSALIFAFLATMTATAWVAMGMSASLFLTAAIVGIGFPALEAICCVCGIWRYDPKQTWFLPLSLNLQKLKGAGDGGAEGSEEVPGIPVWLVPLWTSIVLLIVHVSKLNFITQ
jgi:hypothetical protein